MLEKLKQQRSSASSVDESSERVLGAVALPTGMCLGGKFVCVVIFSRLIRDIVLTTNYILAGAYEC
jgi:hypothetical protein